MRPSIVPYHGAQPSPHILVIGNQKGGSGKSTFAMHIIVALLDAGKRVACFDLDLSQQTLTRYLGNRREWGREHQSKLKLPDYYPAAAEVTSDKAQSQGAKRGVLSRLLTIGRARKHRLVENSSLSGSADLKQFLSRLKEIGRARKHDFVVIDTPGSAQHLSLIAHGMADTLITPINDSLIDLDVLVAMERSDVAPRPSVYAKTVWRALEARRKVNGRATDWIVVRNRLESVESSNQRRVTQALDVIRATLGFRIARGLLERPVYREFFAAGLTVLDSIEGFEAAAAPARLEVQNLMREIGLIEENHEQAIHDSELKELKATVTDKALCEESDQEAVTTVPALPIDS